MTEAHKKSFSNDFVIEGQQSVLNLGRMFETRLDARIQRLISDDLGTPAEQGLIVEADTLVASFKDPKSLLLSFMIRNNGHKVENNYFAAFSAHRQIVMEVAVEDAHRYLYLVDAPLSHEECKEWIIGDDFDGSQKSVEQRKSEGMFWATGRRYDRDEEDFTEEDFSSYCAVSKINALSVQLTALRNNKEALQQLARDSINKFIDNSESTLPPQKHS